MCVAFILWRCLEHHVIVLAFNRDEAFHRATLSAHWWKDKDSVVGGRDGVGGGTWLLTSITGRLAFVTNVRYEKLLQRTTSIEAGRPSRGGLPVAFVESEISPREFSERLRGSGPEYPGFNLIVADLSATTQKPQEQDGTGGLEERGGEATMYYATNHHRVRNEKGKDDLDDTTVEIRPLHPGIHGISNAPMDETTDEQWPKVALGKRRLEAMIERGDFDSEECPFQEIFEMMTDATQLHSPENPEKLPETGYGIEFETAASGIFVEPMELDGSVFGTRSITVLAVRKDGFAELHERCLNDGKWTEEIHSFHMNLVR